MPKNIRRQSRFLNEGRQSFPVPGHAGFPLDLLLIRYTSRLVKISPLHADFFDVIILCLGFASFSDTVEELFGDDCQDDERTELIHARNTTDLAYQVMSLLVKYGTRTKERRFRNLLSDKLVQKCRASEFPPAYSERRQQISGVLALSEVDVAILEFCVCYKLDRSFESYCDSYPISDWPAMMASALQVSCKDVTNTLRPAGALKSKGLLEIESRLMTLSKEVFEYTAGISDRFFADELARVDTGDPYEVDSFPIPPESIRVLRCLIRSPQPCHLFFHGKPGTGKTEFAKALAAEAGIPVFWVNDGGEANERSRKTALCAAAGLAPAHAVLIVDEADSLLNTRVLFRAGKVDKGWINQFMDQSKHKVIWIANESDEIERSVLRRFAFSHAFHSFSREQRIRFWKRHVKGSSLERHVSPAMIEGFADRYELDAGGISAALHAAGKVFRRKKMKSGDLEKILSAFLDHHAELSGISVKRAKLNPVNEAYDINAVNSDVQLGGILKALKTREKRNATSRDLYAANLLLWGAPGTGKTEFAKYLAKVLGKELLVKRMSDLQSMYVGQTEKRIAEAFRQASQGDVVLFLDEADSLLIDRRHATRSWETSQTNEVLTQMENFSGICICCTNLVEGLDEAAMRRFTWKIKFLPLSKEGRIRMYRRYFQPTGRLSAFVEEALAGLDPLTPGDFKTVWLRRELQSGPMSDALLLDELRLEMSYKNRSGSGQIGF